jgi:hypothetical protein
MKDNIEFEKIGRNISYEVPEGFFENVSQKTLQLIKQRELRQKKVFVIRIVAAAASLAILVSITLFLSRSGVNSDKKELSEQRIESPQGSERPILENTPNESKKNLSEKSNAVKPAIHSGEKIDDILSDLSEEDLLQLAALYKADPFNE